MNAQLIQLSNKLTEQLLECQAQSTAWLVKAGQIINHFQQQLPHGDMTAIHRLGRLPWSRRHFQVLAALGRNPALCDPKLLAMLPSSIAALGVIAADLDANLINEGLRNRTLNRMLTRKTALAAAGKLRRDFLLSKPSHSVQ